MIKVIVDTNIIFSSILNSNSTIGDLIFNSNPVFKFYSCNYMQSEIEKHWSKLKRISKLTDNNLNISRLKIFNHVYFINEELVPEKTWLKAEQLVSKIDIDDSDFVALTEYLKGKLWTGDKQLYNGLHRMHYKRVVNTQELFTLRTKLTGK